MKKLFLTLIFSALFFTLSAQDYEILSVESLPADFSPREEMKTDHSGHQCALLRIATQKISPEQRERFTFGTDLASEIVERVTRDGEIWLWVSPGLKILRVKHKDWGQYEIKMLDYVTRVEPLHTYKITIKGPDVQPVPESKGETFTVNGVSFVMKLVEGGSFLMGSDDSDAGSSEKPVHSVSLSSYYIGETEVTQALWQAVMGSNPNNMQGDDLPVGNVSWNDVQEFIRMLNQKTRQNFRLPTEAEWEYAARGGKKNNGYKYSGSDNIGSVAWYDGKSNNKTHAVKTKSPNELGLYDMSGNVFELCQDWYGSDYYGESSSTNPLGPPTGYGHVIRGGSYSFSWWSCRVSSRGLFSPDGRDDNFGFRLCLSQLEGFTSALSVTENGGNNYGIQMEPVNNAPEGAVPSKFSVGNGKKVYFAKGNLQYRASTRTWRFAEHQWDCIGDDNIYISSSYNGWIDLFGRGTGDKPTNKSVNNSDYLFFREWGDNMGAGWRTLTKDEWKYIFDERSTSSGIRYAKATVNGVCGVILLPDDWSKTLYNLNETNKYDAGFNSNSIISSTWNSIFAPAGAVFLPAAGHRYDTSVFTVGENGNYWSVSDWGVWDGYFVVFNNENLNPTGCTHCYYGCSVRLVAPAEN